MSRARNIKPSFFTNDALAECPPLARLLFVGLWTIADREGRIEDRPKRIKAEVLPYDDCDCDELLATLESHGFIARYAANNNKYIQVVSFSKHQNPHLKEAASTIPAPDKPGANTIPAGPLTDSLLLIPESITPPKESKPKTASVTDEDFEKIRKAYPKNNGAPKPARKSLGTALKAASLNEIEAGAKRYAAHCDAEGTEIKYRKHLATWLNEAGWETEYTSKSDPPPPISKDSSKVRFQEWLKASSNNRDEYFGLRKTAGEQGAMEQLKSKWNAA